MTDHDMPKLQSPFKRALVDGRYVLTTQRDPFMEWFFNSKNLMAVEKLDGTNVSIVIENSTIVRAYNRMNPIPVYSNHRLWEGILNSCKHELLIDSISTLPDGQHFGELIGPGIQENAMNLKEKLWVPFNTFGRDKLTYAFPTELKFEDLEWWMKNSVRSLLFEKLHGDKTVVPEGVVFHDTVTGEMAKLRSDMFQFWYEDPSHRPHKFKEEKVIVKKEPTQLDIEMKAHAKLKGTISDEVWISQRNEILKRNGITLK